MRLFLASAVIAALAGCTSSVQPECTKAADCAATTQSSCLSCPATAARYCEGTRCVDKGAADRAITLNLTTPRQLPLRSLRWTAVTFRSTKEIASCAGTAGCTADAVTCETIAAEGIGGASQNVAATGTTNTDTMNGAANNFPGIQISGLTREPLLFFLEGRTETLGNGETAATLCRVIGADDSTADVTLAQ